MLLLEIHTWRMDIIIINMDQKTKNQKKKKENEEEEGISFDVRCVWDCTYMIKKGSIFC